MGTSNKKTMSPLTADQQKKVDGLRKQGWSIEKIARELLVSEKRVSAYLKSMTVQEKRESDYLKSMAAQLEATSAKKPKEGKKVADKKAVKADKKPCKCGKCKKNAKAETSKKGVVKPKDGLDKGIEEVINEMTKIFQHFLKDCIREWDAVSDVIKKGVTAEAPKTTIKEKQNGQVIATWKKTIPFIRPRVVVVHRMG